MRNRRPGFSLIELLVVIAIILVIAALAIPNLMRSRLAANEAAAVHALRILNTASTTYSTTYGNGYPPSLAAVAAPANGSPGCNNAGLVDDILASGTKSGYTFTYTGAGQLVAAAPNCAAAGYYNFTITADPVTRGITGQRSFFIDQSGVIRFNPTQASTVNDPPIT